MVLVQHCTHEVPSSFVVQVTICLAMHVVPFPPVSLVVSPVPTDHLHQTLHYLWSRYTVCSLFHDAVRSIGRGIKMNNNKLEVTRPWPNLLSWNMPVVTEENHETPLSMAHIQVEFRNEYFPTANQRFTTWNTYIDLRSSNSIIK